MHCFAGQSRSAALVTAYLISREYHFSTCHDATKSMPSTEPNYSWRVPHLEVVLALQVKDWMHLQHST